MVNMLVRERTGKPGAPRILAKSSSTGNYLHHFHSGLKCRVKVLIERRGTKWLTVGHRCPVCGFIPNDAVRKEQQDLLEKMLLRGFKQSGRRRA